MVQVVLKCVDSFICVHVGMYVCMVLKCVDSFICVHVGMYVCMTVRVNMHVYVPKFNLEASHTELVWCMC